VLWAGGQYGRALDVLAAGVHGAAEILVLTGDVGAGKTILANALVERLQRSGIEVARVDYPCAEPHELLHTIADALGLEPAGPEAAARLREHLRRVAIGGARVLLVLEEAQSMGPALLHEMLRLLAWGRAAEAEGSQGIFSVLVVGQESLDDMLGAPEQRAVAARVGVRVRLGPLPEADVRSYVEHQLALAGLGRDTFTPLAVRMVAQGSRGIPRLINAMADRALTAATRHGIPVVGSEQVRDAIEDVGAPASAAAGPTRGDHAPPRREGRRGLAVLGRAPWSAIALVAVALVLATLALAAGHFIRLGRPVDPGRDAAPGSPSTAPVATAEPSGAGSPADEPPSADDRPLGAHGSPSTDAAASRPRPPEATRAREPHGAAARAPDPRPGATGRPAAGATPAQVTGATPVPDTDGTPAQPAAGASAGGTPVSRPAPPREERVEPGGSRARPVGSPEPGRVAAPERRAPLAPAAPPVTRPPHPGDSDPDPGSIIDWLLKEAPRRGD
jgi:general secretion pathway protein A